MTPERPAANVKRGFTSADPRNYSIICVDGERSVVENPLDAVLRELYEDLDRMEAAAGNIPLPTPTHAGGPFTRKRTSRMAQAWCVVKGIGRHAPSCNCDSCGGVC